MKNRAAKTLLGAGVGVVVFGVVHHWTDYPLFSWFEQRPRTSVAFVNSGASKKEDPFVLTFYEDNSNAVALRATSTLVGVAGGAISMAVGFYLRSQLKLRGLAT